MDTILEQVSETNKEWVKSLGMSGIGMMLDKLADHMRYVVEPEPDLESEPESEPEPEPEHKISSVLDHHTSSVKGIRGEIHFEEIFKENMPSDYKLLNVASTGKSGDFIISWRSPKTNKLYKILVDVKNYKSTVPYKEVEKFFRDINLHADITGGIILSLYSKISRSKTIEFNDLISDHGIVPTLYMTNNHPASISEFIKILFHIIEIKDINRHSPDINEQIQFYINSLYDSISLVTQCRNTLMESKLTLESSFNQITLNLMRCEYELFSKISNINALLRENIDTKLNDIKTRTIEEKEKNDSVVKNVIAAIGTTLDLGYEVLLYDIWNVGWETANLDLAKKKWELSKNTMHMSITFKKTMVVVLISTVDMAGLKTIQKNKKLGKIGRSGYTIPLNKDTIEVIKDICHLE